MPHGGSFRPTKEELPTLFAMNEIMGVSDGVEARFGTLTRGWERFKPWRTIEGDEEAGSSASQLQVAVGAHAGLLPEPGR